MHQITNYSIGNMYGTLILTVYQRNIHKQFEANPCSGLKEVKCVTCCIVA